MIRWRKRPIHYMDQDPRTYVVVDRLERVAEQMERLAAEMEIRLRIRGEQDREGNGDAAGGS